MLTTRLIIKPKDIALIFDESYENARKRYKAAKDALEVKHLTFVQYCEYERLDYLLVCQICEINPINY